MYEIHVRHTRALMSEKEIDKELEHDPVRPNPVRSTPDIGAIRIPATNFSRLWKHVLGTDFYINALLLEFRNHGDYGEYPLSIYGTDGIRQILSKKGFTGDLCDLKWLVWDMLAGMPENFSGLKHIECFTGILAFCIAMSLEKNNKFKEIDWITLQHAYEILSKDLTPDTLDLLHQNILWQGKYFWWLTTPKFEMMSDALFDIAKELRRLPESDDEFLRTVDSFCRNDYTYDSWTPMHYDSKASFSENIANNKKHDNFPLIHGSKVYLENFSLNYDLFICLNKYLSQNMKNTGVRHEIDWCCTDKTRFYKDKFMPGISHLIVNYCCACPSPVRRAESGGRDTETGGELNADSDENSAAKGGREIAE